MGVGGGVGLRRGVCSGSDGGGRCVEEEEEDADAQVDVG